MFRCDSCGGVSSKGQSPVFVVVEGRRRQYRSWSPPPVRGRLGSSGRRSTGGDGGGSGWEVVKEMKVCRECGKKLADQPAKMQQAGAASPVEVEEAPQPPAPMVATRLGG